jgi:prepilin-type N-terminal cleavage/methylation domain-containing protein
MKNRAFTLIELLVVIAIIAILAAILFPVFAQAKSAAKKAASLSNTKQLGTAAYTYMSDVDDTMPIFFTRITGGVCLPNDPTQCGYRSMWQMHLHPYMKNWQIYTAPGDTQPANNVNAAFNISYGYNYGYLSNLCVANDALSAAYGCSATDPGSPASGSWFQGISSTSVTRPANIIMFGDNGGKSISSPQTISSMLNPPDAWPANKYFFGPVQVGWGPNCQNYFHESAGGAGFSTGKYKNWDGFAPRYSDGGNVVFVDSHAKFFKPGNLVAGTNSNNLTTACTALLVTDYSNYMWDPRYDMGTQR